MASDDNGYDSYGDHNADGAPGSRTEAGRFSYGSGASQEDFNG